MRRAIKLAAVVAALALIMPAAVQARAIPPLGITFNITTIPGNGSPNGGPFVAGGPAVYSGWWTCTDGTTQDMFLKGSGKAPTGTNYQVVKRFACTDLSGYFDIKMQVRWDRKGNNYSWTVVDGTGPYATLKGSGSGYGVVWFDPSGNVTEIDDHLTGALHF